MKILDKLTKKKTVSDVSRLENEVKKEDKKEFTEGLVSTKDIIAPASLEVDFNHIRIGDKFYRTLFVASYPRFVGVNWLSSLINFDATLSISMYVYPTDGKAILDDLRRKITEMEAEISTDIQRGRLINPATQAKLEDALNLQADLVKGEERFFQFGLYITIEADSKQELDRINKNIEASMGSLLLVTKRATLQMEDGFVTGLPLNSDRVNINRNMDTTSLATTFPFVSSDLSDDKGIMYGINMHNGSLVIFDRFSMQNYNSVVFATAGAGKSYMIKLEVLRSLMLGTEIIVIDPENEYKDLTTAVGGQYIAFGYGEESKINPFDLSLAEDEGENALNNKVLAIHRLMKIMLGNLDPIEESLLDRAIMEAYKAKGITPDPATQNREPPLIEDTYKALIGMEDQKAQMLAARMEKYIKGSFAGIFNQKTTVNLTNQFVVFGIKNLEDTLRPVAMNIILDYIWTVVKKNLKKRLLIVDEAWYLMQYEDSASFLRGIVKRGRKYYLGVTTITQDVDDFLKTAYGKEIVTNSSIQILLKQHPAAIDQIGEVFYLSEGEKQLLLMADKGQGIFFAGQNHVAIEVIASEEEHNLITSNPEDVLQKKKNLENIKKQAIDLKNSGKNVTITPLPSKPQPKADQPLVETQHPITTPAPQPKIEAPIPQPKTDQPLVETPTPKNNILEEIKPELKTNDQKDNIEDVLQRKIKELENSEVKKPENLEGQIKIEPQKLVESPRFVPPKTEILNQENQKKPVFIGSEETKIPQPPQLTKKPQPIFDSTKQNEKSEEKKKLDYDDLFSNGIV